MIFLLLTVFITLISLFTICMICTNTFVPRRATQLERIIDVQMAREEAAKRPSEAAQDGAVGHPLLAEHWFVKETHTFAGDM